MHDQRLVTESAAIALYLTDLFPERPLGAPLGDPRRGAYLTWLAFYAGVMEPAIAARFAGQASPEIEAMDRRIVSALEAAPYLLGDAFSAADLMLASVVQFSRAALPEASLIDEHFARASARPAWRRALAKDE